MRSISGIKVLKLAVLKYLSFSSPEDATAADATAAGVGSDAAPAAQPKPGGRERPRNGEGLDAPLLQPDSSQTQGVDPRELGAVGAVEKESKLAQAMRREDDARRETILEGAAAGARLTEAQVRQYSYFCTSKASKMSSKEAYVRDYLKGRSSRRQSHSSAAAGARLTDAQISIYMCMLIYYYIFIVFIY